MSSCYILYSASIDRYYVGSTTLPVEDRLARHNEVYYDGKWTAYGAPWDINLCIACDTISQARAIESHVKRMESRTCIENLKRYPEMIKKLSERHADGPDCYSVSR